MFQMKFDSKDTVIAAAALLMLACAAGCRQARLKRVSVDPSPVSVAVQIVCRDDNVSQRSYVGSVEAAKAAILSSTHSGTLVQLNVRSGCHIDAGQIAARVSSPAVVSSCNAARASLEQARDGYERARKLFEAGSIPEVKMVEIRTQLSQAEAAAQAASNALDECAIRAPFSGEVVETFVQQGERVVIGQTILSIMDASGLEVSISVPENEVGGISVGDGALVTFPALEGNVTSRASVKSKSLTSSSLSHSYKCTLRLQRVPAGLMSGMVCKVRMDRDNARGIVIPADVVKIDSEGRYVWTVEDGIVQKTRITVGGFSGKGVIVDSGLRVGDMLIVEGASKVCTGMKVNVR